VARIAAAVTPGSAAASIFGESTIVLRPVSVQAYAFEPSPVPNLAKPLPATPPPVAEAPKPRPERRMADMRSGPIEPAVEPRSSSFQPTFRQVARKSQSAWQSLYDVVARQPKEAGIVSVVVFVISVSMLGSGSLAAAMLGALLLIAAVTVGDVALAVMARDVLNRHDPR
jgi:hypothetical protein